MSDGLHVVVPLAAPARDEALRTLAALRLPATQRLLATLALTGDERDSDATLSMPHERAIARARGLPVDDGRIALAAWEVASGGGETGGQAWAWITPCHWQVGTAHILMQDPQDLRLDPQDAAALLASMQPYFAQDGLELRQATPQRWLARGPLLAQVATASLDRVAGRVIDAWMPRGDAARPLRRLQQEMQMLLYTHPVSDARQHQGLPAVNSFWASGSGTLPAGTVATDPPGLQVLDTLHDAARRQDWPAWAGAWQRFDADEAPRLLQALQAGRAVQLTLCGERGSRTWSSARKGWLSRIGASWSRAGVAQSLQDL